MVAEKSNKLPDTVPVYNINDGVFGRQNGGPYLDEVQAAELEEQRAKVEGRKVDHDSAHAFPGLQLVTGEELLRVWAHTLPAGTGVPQITAKVYGHIPNPAKVAADAVKEETAETVARAENAAPKEEK